MKFLLAILLLLAPGAALAHSPNQAPFLLINGDSCPFYNVGGTSLQNFPLPQDAAPKNYLVKQNLHFEFIKDNLPFLPDEFSKVVMDWDFGDGTKATGFTNDHTYTQIGSKTLTVFSKLPTDSAPVLLDRVLINVLPKADYQLPKAIFTINGQKTTNPYTDILKASFKQDIRFDAGQSTGGSSSISSYLWDYGDGQAGRGKQNSHTYAAQYSAVAPLVRVTTKDGFIADTFTQIENQTLDVSATAPANYDSSKNLTWYIGSGIFVLIILALVVRFRRRK